MLQPLASAMAVLNDDEKDLGVCLMDIGGGTTDIAVFVGGAIRHTAVIPIAGDQVTNDIAMTLRTPTKEAEELKVRHGCALRQLADPNDIIEVPGVGERAPRKLSRPMLAEVIEPRIEELYTLVQAELRRSGFEELLSSGIVLTGGSALLQGMTELGEEVFHLPVRVGVPTYVGGLAGSRAQPALRDRRRTAARRTRAVPARAGRARAGRGHRRRRRADEAMVQGEFLTVANDEQTQSGSRQVDIEWTGTSNRAASRHNGIVVAVIATSRQSIRYIQTGKEHTMFEIIDQAPEDGAVIKVIGVGGCGGNAVEHMIDRGLVGRRVHLREHRRAGAEALDGARRSCSSAATLTRGLGAGARPEIGRDAAMEDRDRIAEMIDGADMLFITAGMGGGTGTGAAPVIADIAKSMGILTVAVVTRPFKFEGKRQQRRAGGHRGARRRRSTR